MRRAVALLVALAIAFGVAPVANATVGVPGAVTWIVDHDAKTITAIVRIQIYAGCSGKRTGPQGNQPSTCFAVDSQVTGFLAQKIKKQAEAVWNKGYKYRCYRFRLIVDVTTATSRSGLADDRIGVMIDPSFAGIRDHVSNQTGTSADWTSNDPSAAVTPGHDGSVWGEETQSSPTIYAHEVGHLLGLDDHYHDVTDSVSGRTWSVPNDGAPFDLMSTGAGNIDQSTINRVVERNRDRLQDTQGGKVDLDDLVCDRIFRAALDGSSDDYRARHTMNSMAQRPCTGQPRTSSSDQRLLVSPETVDVMLVEDAAAAGGYRLAPVFDQLALQAGMSSLAFRSSTSKLFDIAVTVRVDRRFSEPATGTVPQVFDVADKVCADAGPRETPRPDCGRREYRTWLALEVQPGGGLWPVASSLPRTLSGIGYSPLRLDRLYRNCPGEPPWPGWIREENGSSVQLGQLPSFETLKKVSDDWRRDGRPGSVTIDGGADLDRNVPGTYVESTYEWHLKLCPIDKDGNTPPGCL